jgi:endoglucanase
MDVNILKKLSESSGVSGFEEEIKEIIKKEISKYADKITEDNLGNLIALKKGSAKNRKKIALVAHMDEIGLIVKRVDKGFIEFSKIGGIDDRTLLLQKVVIRGNKPIEGVIGCKPVHLQKEEEKKKVIKYDEMYIDIGAEDKKKLNIEKGTPISFKSEFKQLQENTFIGKALDNRLGVYCLIDILKKMKSPKNDIYFIFSTQEEVGLKGARTSVYSIEPDLAVVVDTAIAGDVPAVTEKETEIKLGKGVSITLIEAGGQGAILPEKLKNYIVNIARKNKIKYQLEVVEGGMTDAAIIQILKKGILSCSVNIPIRNMHTPHSIFDVRDLKETIKLVELIVKNWK